MSLLNVEKVSKSYGDKLLLQNVSFTISKGDKIALVAKNGAGKSTLLKMLAGIDSPEGEESKIIWDKQTKIGFLTQSPIFNTSYTLLDAALDSENESLKAIKSYELALLHSDNTAVEKAIARIEDLKAWDIESRVKEVLGKLKLLNYDQKVATLSGGQLKRLALAKIIIENPDFLILDEPTNHLDIEMIEWLEKYFQKSSMTIFLVTHDRYFLERICTQIFELDLGNIHVYRGNYTDFLEKKSVRILNDQARHDKVLKLFKKELDWVRRQPKARTTKSKSRVDAFDNIYEETKNKQQVEHLNIPIVSERLGKLIVEFTKMSKSFGEIQIIDDFNYKFKKGEKLGIVGENGTGKTTFIELMMQLQQPSHGKIRVGETVRFGYYTQIGLDNHKDIRVIEVVRNIAEFLPLSNGHKLSAEKLLERFLFPRSQHRVFISKLSGGERRRLHLLTVLMSNPNFLILDEPTNDLDIMTLNILEDYLSSFEGCVVVITHDRFFLDKIVDHLLIFQGNGKVRDYNGTYSAYRKENKLIKKQSVDLAKILKEESTNSRDNLKAEKKQIRLSYFEKKELNSLESELEKLEREKENIQEQFMLPEIKSDRIQELSIRIAVINKEIESKETRWLELSEKL